MGGPEQGGLGTWGAPELRGAGPRVEALKRGRPRVGALEEPGGRERGIVLKSGDQDSEKSQRGV